MLVTPEAAEDLQWILSNLSVEEFRLMLERSIEENGADTLRVHKQVAQLSSGEFTQIYTLKFSSNG
jgi:hypothetical protein